MQTHKSKFLKGLIICFLWVGVFYSRSGVGPQYFPDTPGYFPEPKQLEGYFSLSGSALRGWPTVGIYWLAGSATQALLLQTLIYAVAWTFLLFALFKSHSGFFLYFGAVLIVVYALTPRVIQWNQFLLSESLSISLVIIGAASLLLATEFINKRRLNLSLSWVGISGLFFSMSAVNRATLLPLVTVPLILFLVQINKFSRKRFFSLALIGFLILAVIYPIFYNTKTNAYWADGGKKLYRSSFYFLYNTVEGSLQPEWGDDLWKYVNSKSPECLIWYRTHGYEPTRNPYFLAEKMTTDCPQAAFWLNENYDNVYFKYISEHPAETFSYAFEMLNLIQDSTEYAYKTILPIEIVHLFESKPTDNSEIRSVYFWLSLPIFAVLLLSVNRIKPTLKIINSSLIYVVALASITLTQFAIVSEPVRITTPATVLTITFSIIVFSQTLAHIRNKSSLASGK